MLSACVSPLASLPTNSVPNLCQVRQDDLASTSPPTIGIVPSSLFCAPHRRARRLSLESWRKQDLRVCVPYSLHACFKELESFVRGLQPKQIIGIVKPSKDTDNDPKTHLSHLLTYLPSIRDTQGIRRHCI